jgi:hypothetical protein
MIRIAVTQIAYDAIRPDKKDHRPCPNGPARHLVRSNSAVRHGSHSLAEFPLFVVASPACVASEPSLGQNVRPRMARAYFAAIGAAP